MSDPFFGELYLRSTRPFLSAEVTRAECEFLRGRLPEGPLLDLACGHGRHLSQVPGSFGVDREPISLKEALTHRPVARAELALLPFRDGAFVGGWCWYNSLGTFEDDAVPPVLAELARCMRPGARIIIHGSNRARAEAQPDATYDGELWDGDHLVERARYNAARKRDEIHRRLTLGDGSVLEADFFIRYYDLDEWSGLLEKAGFSITWSAGGLDGAALDERSADLIVGAERRDTCR